MAQTESLRKEVSYMIDQKAITFQGFFWLVTD